MKLNEHPRAAHAGFGWLLLLLESAHCWDSVAGKSGYDREMQDLSAAQRYMAKSKAGSLPQAMSCPSEIHISKSWVPEERLQIAYTSTHTSSHAARCAIERQPRNCRSCPTPPVELVKVRRTSDPTHVFDSIQPYHCASAAGDDSICRRPVCQHEDYSRFANCPLSRPSQSLLNVQDSVVTSCMWHDTTHADYAHTSNKPQTFWSPVVPRCRGQ